MTMKGEKLEWNPWWWFLYGDFYMVILCYILFLRWFWCCDFDMVILTWWFYVKLVERGGPVVVVYVFGRKKVKGNFSSNITYKNHHIKSPYKIIIQNFLQDHEDHPAKPQFISYKVILYKTPKSWDFWLFYNNPYGILYRWYYMVIFI